MSQFHEILGLFYIFLENNFKKHTCICFRTLTQAVLNKIWWGRISKNEKCYNEELFSNLFLRVWCFSDKSRQNISKTKTKKNRRGFMWSTVCPFLAPRMLTFDGEYTNVQKIKCFLNAPRTIFTYNVIFYFFHNLLFARVSKNFSYVLWFEMVNVF